MRALSIRQPYAELILRGIKGVEFRSRPTTRIGERFYIYVASQRASGKLYLAGCSGVSQNAECRTVRPCSPQVQNEGRKIVTSDNLAMPGSGPEPWMMELASMLILKDLPTGVVVGSAVIEKVTHGDPFYQWHLADVERAKKLRKPRGQPQPVWFTPFD